ncbi:beta-L-arabinofuranosidase domain-containing protein, partial [Parvularcula oceani]|uniref:beta-L-arabinofuranosidase domain-containing protein n=1 Tax=Parvularcula oceani TaxID=1247963 RepID=UPI000561AE02
TTVERDGEILDGKIVFEEIRRGEIHTGGFDINGGWVPLYTWHKVQAGLIDAYRHAGLEEAMPILLGMAGYLADVLEPLDHGQMQKLLAAEHGGLNEAYADLHVLTGERRWLDLARRLRHEAVLDPLAEGVNALPGLHANTQIPKVIGLARLYETAGAEADAAAARYFYRTVTDHHSYAIGGNSEREHFRPPDVIAGALSDRTCEACNSYNMLKLTRHLYAWEPDAALFDKYENTYVNHILAHQHPDTGMFVYFMPMSSGAYRTYSTPEDSFWCCVGSGMESHAKHGDSAFWQRGGEALIVNLYMPARVDWREGGMRVRLSTSFPRSEEVALTVEEAPRGRRTLALRLPGWCAAPEMAVNGEPVEVGTGPGYAELTRRWREGDRVEARFPMRLAVEPSPDEPGTVTFRHGPLVLAADLGPADERYDVLPPALVAREAEDALRPAKNDPFAYELAAAVPAPVTLRPFYDQYERRTAVYFPSFTPEDWKAQEAAFRAEQAARRRIQERTLDVIHLGEMQPERDHDFASNQSDVVAFGGRNGRQAWWGVGNFIEFDLAVGEGPVILQALYWGEEVDKNFQILVDGQKIATERRAVAPRPEFVTVAYPLPEELTRGKSEIRVRFETLGTDAPVYECRTLKAQEA